MRSRVAAAVVWTIARAVRFLPAVPLFAAVAATPAAAEVVRLDVQQRQPLAGTPSYELLTGTVTFAIDPRNRHDQIIADIDKAPRNRDGRVEFSADFAMLKPADPSTGNGALLVEAVNRGNKLALGLFNRGGNPGDADAFGDRFLLKQGFTVAWVGWQADLTPANPRLMRLRAPVATTAGATIHGWVRREWTPAADADVLDLADADHIPYDVVDPDSTQHVLSLRDVDGPSQIIARAAWRFVRAGDAPAARIAIDGGFRAGRQYQLVYRASGPVLAGLGLAAIRDVAAYFRHDRRAPFQVQRALAFGVSQSGRLLRTFLYDGFNTDEAGRRVFDGFFIHVAGASRGSFNQRFAQPSFSGASATLFPFADSAQMDPQTRRSESLLDRVGTDRPKIFYTNSSTEYWWLRRAALQHTTVDGAADLALPPFVRLYVFAGTQHVPTLFPPSTERAARALSNPQDYSWAMRSLLLALDKWVKDDKELPPPSLYPRIDDGTLVPLSRLKAPQVPGFEWPRRLVERTERYDYGREFRSGLVDFEPPHEGGPLPVLLPQVDADGNEVAGIRLPDVAVPLATYTGWNLRRPESSGARLVGLTGSFVPFARTREERDRSRDPRPSIAERYADSNAYLAKYRDAVLALVDKRYLLDADVTAIMTDAAGQWLALSRAPRVQLAAQPR